MTGKPLSKHEHVILLVLMGAVLIGILLAAGIYLPEFWFWVVWVILGLGGWSNRYYDRRKTPAWAIIPAGVFGAAAMLYYMDKFIMES
jgi:hypothetical protein